MRDAVVAAATLDELFTFVHAALCEQDHLEPSEAPLVKIVLSKVGRPCGMLFHVEGPRLLRTSAVWAADENRVLIYDSTGQRVREVTLSESPDIPDATRKSDRRAA
ncbi:MAG: hypothetical protein ACRC7O_16185 [Fimbriiglobus sp.]